MSEPIAYLNGEFMPESRAKINVYDLGFVLGATLTEMTRTFRHNSFRLPDHVARLFRSAKYCGINLKQSPSELVAKTEELIAHNSTLIDDGSDLGIVHFVTPGENRIYAGSAAASARMEPTVGSHSFALPFSVWRYLFVDGAHLVTPSIRHVPPQCVDPKMKNRSRLHWFLAEQQAHLVDAQAITLLLDLDGNITECSGSNVVVIKDGTIYSPPLRNILEGISLCTVRDLAARLGLTVAYKDMQTYDVVNADEVWLTTTPYCIAPCTKINGVPIGNGKPGPLFAKMISAWSDLVGMDITQQIMDSKL
jgi:branched-chain amino acid aminotransferase